MLDGSATARVRLSPELVAFCERPEPKQGPEPGLAYFSEGDYQAAADRFLAEASDGPLWVFAYGSLLWSPAFNAEARHLAEAKGWRREFCMEIRRWRGSPEQPGLMMGLRKGGTCSGVVLQLAHDDRRGQLVRLLRREVDTDEDLQSVRWIEADTSLGKVRALACWAEPVRSRMFVEKSIEEQAHMLARACGFGGSGAAYLHRTMTSLAGLGIADDYLTTLDELVAQEIIGRTGFSVSSL
ncbi:gamma-glutamylcyclotransferase [Taklimakanibacter deserti]|uniref:gamma-glutamylcyclotransferase n=1 Tax=Taklimakanibacter deserti TaxID=2267839 RepID=UPI0013C4EA46